MALIFFAGWHLVSVPVVTLVHLFVCKSPSESAGRLLLHPQTTPDLPLFVVCWENKRSMVTANTSARHFFRLDLLELIPGAVGEHTFVSHLLHLFLLEMVPGPGEHIVACHFLRLDLLEVAGPGDHYLCINFWAWTCYKWSDASANTFLRVTFVCVTFCARTCSKWCWAPPSTFVHVTWSCCLVLLELVAGPREHILTRHFLRLDPLDMIAGPSEK